MFLLRRNICMSKWEDKYNRYKDGGIDNVISELTTKEILTKEEKKEYRKLIKIKEKMPQVENVVEYRDKLKEELEQIKKEMSIRNSLKEATDKRDKLEKEIAEYQDKYEKINKKLKNKDLADEERRKLEAEKTEISEKMPRAQEERDKVEDTLTKALGEKRELSTLEEQEISEKMFEKQTKISKCNLVAKNLLNGLNWEQIDIKLDNWKDKKFTSKDDKLSKDIEEAKKEREEKVNNFKLEIKEEIDDLDKEEKTENNKPAITFADKHPRLAKIGKFFRNIINRFSNKEKEEIKEEKIEETKVEKAEGTEIEKAEETKVENVEKSFKEYIKEIAEKGMNEIKKEELQAKLVEMRKANREAEAKKFGQNYADKSDYRNDGSER